MIPQFLTQQYPLEKHLYLIPRFTFGLLGFNPETKKATKVQLWAFFNFCILGYGIYAELRYGIHYLSIDIPTALDALCPVATSIISFLKIIYIWWYREEFKFLMERVRVLTAEQTSKSKVKVKQNYFTLATRLTTLVLFFGICCSTSYSLRPIVNNTILYMNGKDIVYETPFKMMFPESLLAMPLYPLTYLLVHWHGYMTVLAFAGVAGLFFGFSVYISTILKALQEDVQDILAEHNDKNNIRYNSEEKVCQALEDVINRHNEVAELTAKFSMIMVEITLSQFITSSMIIAISIVDILLFSGLSILVYVTYACGIFAEMFLYCLGGNIVMDTSEELATKVYCSEWYSHSIKVQKMVLLIMIRSQRTISIKVPFFSPSLPTFSAMLRFTGSVLALANSFL